MDSLTVSSSMLIPSASNVEITPAMLGVLWRVSHELDHLRLPANVDEAKWLEIPASTLRSPDGRNDNHWLKKSLEKLTGVKLEGEYRGNPWGAVILAQWEIIDGGRVARLLIPPAAIQAIRAPKTFAKIEITAAYKLKGHARRLYAALADKKRMGQPYWEYTIPELRQLFDLGDKYPTWGDVRRYVLNPAIDEINDYGTVKVEFSTKRLGRSIHSVRFDWDWKSLDDARYTDEENEQPDGARHMDRKKDDAPPLTDRMTIEAMPELAQRLHNDLDSAHWLSWFKECQFVEEPEIGLVTITANTAFMAKHINDNYRMKIEQLGRLCATPVAKVEIKSRAK